MTKDRMIQTFKSFVTETKEESIYVSYNSNIARDYEGVEDMPTLHVLIDKETKIYYYDNKLIIGNSKILVPNTLIYAFLSELEKQKILKHEETQGELIQYERCKNKLHDKYSFAPVKAL